MKTAGEWALLSPDGTYHKLCEPNFFVGREDEMDLTLKSRSVDKQHAVITADAEHSLYRLHDLGSLNGTFVNEIRVKQQPVDLRLRDNIRFGYDSNTFRVDLYPKQRSTSPTDSHRGQMERQYLLENDNSQREVWEKTCNQSPIERNVSVQSAAQLNSDEDVHPPGAPEQGVFMYHGVHPHHTTHLTHPPQTQYHHFPYHYMPMYHHPPMVCHCSSCTGHRPVHSAHTTSPGGYRPYQPASPANWPHGVTMLQSRPRMQRPLSVPGEKIEMIVKGGSPLYGQPRWWGWGSSDEEIYSYPNTATILDGDSHTAQQGLAIRRKKPLTKKDAIEMAQRRHSIGTVSVLSESKAQIVTTRTSKMTFDPEEDRALKQPEECVVLQKKSALPRSRYSDQLSPVFENSTTMDWECPGLYKKRIEQDSAFPNCDSSADTSPDDGSDGLSRSSYEIPFIPEYDEVPERPVSQKSDKYTPQDSTTKSNTLERQDRLLRRKPSSKIKKKTVHVDTSQRNGSPATGSRKVSSDTSESECEPSSQPSRRSGVVSVSPSAGGVFGLTEVNLQRGNDGGERERLSPAPPLPSWVQQWTNVPNSSESSPARPIEVVDSSSAAEDSTASSVVSNSSHATVMQGSQLGNKPKTVTSASSPNLGRPKSASSRTSTAGVSRSQSLSIANLSSSPKIPTSRVARSKTISNAVRRSYPAGAGNNADGSRRTELPRRRGTVSSTSDDSDVESSDTSQTRRTRNDDCDKKGVQLVPEKDGKRPFSAPRPNKTAMLRAHNSREAVKNSGGKSKSPITARGKTAKGSPSSSSTSGDNVNETSPVARVWTPSPKRPLQSPMDEDNRETGLTGIKSDEVIANVTSDTTQHAVDEIFNSGTSRSLPESLQMNREDSVNKTFVLDEGKADTSVSSVEDAMMAWVETVTNSRNVTESKEIPNSSPSRSSRPILNLEATSSKGISLRSKLIPFAPFLESQPYTPPLPDQPFEPPGDSPDDLSGGSRCSTAEGRPVSPESVTSVQPVCSPSPPLTPGSAARTLFDFKGGGGTSQTRRQWGVTDKPVEDLMLSSIHAFSVELRLASESVLAKVKSLYEGGEELNAASKPRTNSDSKQESGSAIPDWKSSHTEIAGIFRNLRKVELRLRTMEQALSIMCVAAKKEPTQQTFQERKLSMTEMSSSSSGSFQRWRDFKIKARRNSWAVEHRNQFPVPPESEEEDDEDTT